MLTCDLLLCVLTEFVSNLLANGKGAAFFVWPHTGTLGPFETKPVDVTAYTDMWGEYRDSLICKVCCGKLDQRIFIIYLFFLRQTDDVALQVGELPDTLIPVQARVKGCPIYFQMIGPRRDDQNRGPIIR